VFELKEVSDAPIKPVTEAAPDTQIEPVTVVPTRIASTEKKVAKKQGAPNQTNARDELLNKILYLEHPR